jgi:hypothetical protein
MTSAEAFVDPIIDSLTPDHGPSGGGTEVTIAGHGLLTAEFVFVDNVKVPATDQTWYSARFKTPPHTPGTAQVYVVLKDGTPSNKLPFRYT